MLPPTTPLLLHSDIHCCGNMLTESCLEAAVSSYVVFPAFGRLVIISSNDFSGGLLKLYISIFSWMEFTCAHENMQTFNKLALNGLKMWTGSRNYFWNAC
jgi:hypothetical protein